MTDGRTRPRTEEEKKNISEKTKLGMARPEVASKLTYEKMARKPWNKGRKSPGSNPHGIKREFVSNRDYSLFYEYGIRESDYNQMFLEQGGRCLGCGKHQSELNHPLHVDHDHKTGKVRGLLCKLCNSAIGNARDNVNILRSLADYLENHYSDDNAQ